MAGKETGSASAQSAQYAAIPKDVGVGLAVFGFSIFTAWGIIDSLGWGMFLLLLAGILLLSGFIAWRYFGSTILEIIDAIIEEMDIDDGYERATTPRWGIINLALWPLGFWFMREKFHFRDATDRAEAVVCWGIAMTPMFFIVLGWLPHESSLSLWHLIYLYPILGTGLILALVYLGFIEKP